MGTISRLLLVTFAVCGSGNVIGVYRDSFDEEFDIQETGKNDTIL